MRVAHRGHLVQSPAGTSRRSPGAYFGRLIQFSTGRRSIPGNGRDSNCLDYTVGLPTAANGWPEMTVRREWGPGGCEEGSKWFHRNGQFSTGSWASGISMFVLEMDAIELAFREVRCPLCQSCD